MRAAERGFMLLSSCLGNPERRPLSTAQLRTLADRSWQLEGVDSERDITQKDLLGLGYGSEMAQRIVALLEQEEVLDHYLVRGRQNGCVPLTRVSEGYPLLLRKRLGLDSPGVLWAKGDLSVLQMPAISLVGSRELLEDNRQFAQEVGRCAAMQGFALVSGNARGADRTAQDACLEAGGRVIAVVADELHRRHECANVLYLSEEDYDAPFSAQRAISRNRVIHCLGLATIVAQCNLHAGGTWDGTVKNLRFGWSGVHCFDDGSEAVLQLVRMGAGTLKRTQLADLSGIITQNRTLFDQ